MAHSGDYVAIVIINFNKNNNFQNKLVYVRFYCTKYFYWFKTGVTVEKTVNVLWSTCVCHGQNF